MQVYTVSRLHMRERDRIHMHIHIVGVMVCFDRRKNRLIRAPVTAGTAYDLQTAGLSGWVGSGTVE